MGECDKPNPSTRQNHCNFVRNILDFFFARLLTQLRRYEYRKRYANYRTDLDLLESHKQFPWITVWDDHGNHVNTPSLLPLLTPAPEVADNTWKAGSAQLNNTEASFVEDGGISVDQRKAYAVRAHFEWMPIRQVCPYIPPQSLFDSMDRWTWTITSASGAPSTSATSST